MDENFDIPKSWVISKLEQVCEIYQGYGFPKEHQGKKDGKYPFYKVGDISKNVQKGNRYLENCDNYIDEEILSKLRAKLIPANSIVFAKIGEALKLNRRAITKMPCLVDNNAIGLKAIQILCNDLFLYYFLNRIKLENYSRATTVPSVRKSDIDEIKFPIPSLSEQRAIAAKIEQLFSELDSGVENLKKAQAQLKVYRQAVLKWAFEGKLTEEWRKKQKDLPFAETLLAQIKTEREKQAEKSNKKLKPIPPISKEELAKIPKLPKGWVWAKIGYFTLGVEYGTSAKSKKNGKVPVLRMGNIQSGKFNWDDLVFTDDQEEINKYLLKKNDVLFNRTNSPELVGKTAIYKGERQAIFAGYLIRVNQIPTVVNSDYLNYFLNCHYAKKHGFSVKTDGVNQSNINGEKLFNYPISICTFTEQQQIVQEIEDRLSVCDKLEETIAQTLQKTDSLRQSILKKGFAGKLLTKTELEEVRKAPDWEPAEKLLERIKKENEKG